MANKMDEISSDNMGSLRSKVFEKLQNAIIEGQLKDGENLTEVRLSNDLGVSRTPVREAIRQLELEGLVEYIPNKGAVVKGISEKDIGDIFEIRVLIEGLAARWAAAGISDEELNALERALELQEFFTGKNDVEQLMKIDTLFHDIIFSACGSRPLIHVLRMFHKYVQRARCQSLATPQRAEKVYEEHRAIYLALKEHKARRAEELMFIHVKNARVHWLNVKSEDDGEV